MLLEKQIKSLIRHNGAITLAEYMNIALCDENFGYYCTKDPFGESGDFITSPEISQIFGELIGVWLATSWIKIGSPQDIILVEPGAGRGTLMKDILRATRNVSGFHDAISIHIVEINKQLKKVQKKNLSSENIPIIWHNEFSDLPDKKPILLIANEFFDALPIHQFIKIDNKWRENMVGVDDNGELAFVTSHIQAIVPKHMKDAPDGSIYEVSPVSVDITRDIARRIRNDNGAALIIDYGYVKNALIDTFQAIKNHKYHNPLIDVGESDLTAHVNFSSLAKVAIDEGVFVQNVITQGELLTSLGIKIRAELLKKNASVKSSTKIDADVHRLVSPQKMGTLFKCMSIFQRITL